MGTLLRATATRINFNWKKIFLDQTIEIPVQQQMHVIGEFVVHSGGELVIPNCAELAVFN